MIFILNFYFLFISIVWLISPFFSLNIFLINFNVINYSIIQFIHLILQYFFLSIFFCSIFLYNIFSLFFLFNVLTYTGILWTFSNYYWNNWWVFEDFEEIFTLLFNGILLCYLHFFFCKNFDWWALVFIFFFWHTTLKFFKFPSRHSGWHINLIWVFCFLYFYKTFKNIKSTSFTFKLNFYILFLAPILQYSIVYISWTNIDNYFSNDIFLIWLLPFKIYINKFVICYYTLITYQYVLLSFCFQTSWIEFFHIIFIFSIYLSLVISLIPITNNYIYLGYLKMSTSFYLILKNWYYYFVSKIYIYFFLVITLFFLHIYFLFN